MSQKLYVDLQFRADTDSAKKQLQSLQNTLTQVINASMQRKDLGITPQIEQARISAMQLKSALNSATNVDTGKLNLRKFTDELRSSGLNVQKLAKDLRALGPDGQKAFSEMTSAMVSAETKVFSLSNSMQRMASTFANTIRYQVSAAAIQAVTNTISEAIGYTKELNKSLTDVMMVTGLSSNTMKDFAKQANKAAQSLAVSTNEYVKASHIYFQQGLDTAEAMKRAETTIKLAHATGESMEEVSNWMTAIWNNFDNGTKSLEYYGDVLAKLGALTASSADEIAQGLDKFAAVAETVGLSYEYAASALATVTAETRQSADVVGTAFKTLFARMEGLKLGDTLDDGTTLNQYSLALETVGVNIKDVNGEMKSMDTILDETSIKWNTLSKDQQIALAQSVAGVRQYTQFIALMDNYDVMQSNIEMSKAASGSLQEMQETQAESIEGLKEKFGAAKEELISSLLDEDAIKDFYKAMNGIMGFAGKLTKSFGGLKGILMLAASALTKMYQPQIANMFQQMAYGAQDLKVNLQNIPKKIGNSFKDVFKGGEGKKALGKTYAEQERANAIEAQRTMEASQMGGLAGSAITNKIYDLKLKLLENEKRLTQEQKDQLTWQIQLLEKTRETLVEEEKKLEVMKQENMEKADAVNDYDPDEVKKKKEKVKNVEDKTKYLDNMATGMLKEDRVTNPDYNKEQADGTSQQYKDGEKLVNQLKMLKQAAEEAQIDIKDMGFDEALEEARRFRDGSLEGFDSLKGRIAEIRNDMTSMSSEKTASIDRSTKEVDMNYIQTKAEVAGQMEHGTDVLVNTAKNAKNQDLTNADNRKAIAETMQSSLGSVKGSMEKLAGEEGVASATIDTQELANMDLDLEKLGIDPNQATVGFEQIENVIDKFAKDGEADIEELIKVLDKFKQKVDEIGNEQIDLAVNNAVNAAAGDDFQKDLNDMDAGLTSGNADQAGDAAVNAIDKLEKEGKGSKTLTEEKGKIDSAKKEKKAAKEALDNAKKEKKSKEEIAAAEKKYADIKKKSDKTIKDSTKNIQKEIKQKQKDGEITKDNGKLTEEANKIMDERGDKIKDAAQSSKDIAKAEAEHADKVDQVGKSSDRTADRILAAGDAAKNLGNKMAGTFQTATQVASAFMMMQNGIASLTESLASGEASWEDYLSAAMAILPGITQMIGPITKMIGFIAAKAAASRAAAKVETDAAKEEEKASGRKVGASIRAGLAKVAEWMTKGPAGWIIGGIGLAALLALTGVAIASGVKKGQNAAQEKESEEEREINSAAGEVSKNLTGLSEQTDTFKNLRESGESTVNVIKDMGESIKNVSAEIDKLLVKADGDADWQFLGSLKSELEGLKEQLESGVGNPDEIVEQIKQASDLANKTIYQTKTKSSLGIYETSKVVNAKDEAKVQEDLNTFLSDVNGSLATTESLQKQAKEEFFSKTYKNAEEAKTAWANAALKASLGANYSLSNFDDQDLVKNTLLSSAPGDVHQVIRGLNQLAPNGAINAKYNKGNEQEFTNEVLDWIGEDYAKFNYINDMDFSNNSKKALDEEYHNAIERQAYALKTVKAENFDLPEKQFEAYTEALMANTAALKDNEDAAAEHALQVARMGTGLSNVTSKFVEYKTTLAEGKRLTDAGQKASYQYYKALGEMADAMGEAFGFDISADFIQENLSLIEDIPIRGAEAIDELRALLADEFILNFKYIADKDGKGLSIDNQKILFENVAQELRENANANLSQYYDYFNQMILADQINTEDIEKFFAANGKVITLENKKVVGDKQYDLFGDKTEILEGPDSESLFGAFGTPKEHKKLEDEIERYHEINEQLDDIANALDRISKAKDRAFGPKKIALIEMEQKQLEEQGKALGEKAKEMRGNLQGDWDALTKYGASRDEDGRITNYEELYQAQLDALHKAYDLGNEELIEEADKAYDQFVKEFEQYETTLNDYQQLQGEIIDNSNQQYDKQLERVSETLNYELSLVEDKMAVLEYQLENLDDPIYDAAKAMQVLGEQTAATISKVESTQKALEGVLQASGLSMEDFLAGNYGDTELTAEQVDSLREYRDSLLEANTELSQMGDTVMEKVTTAIDTMNEKMAKHGEIIEHNNSLLESYKNIIDLVGKDNLGISDQMIQELRKAQVEGSISAVKASKATLDMNKKALADTEAEFASIQDNLSEEDKKRWEETIDTMKEKVREGESELQASFETSLQTAADAFASAVEDATNALKDAMAGMAGSADDMARHFEQQEEITGRFLEDYEKAYQLSKLNRDITNSIDTTDSIKGKRELYKLQQELLALQEDGVQVTQYESDELRARYELRLAEIALEEAQNAKSQVRMRRDSEGNWSYVYTADQANVDKAEQNYEDKLYAYEKLTHDYVKEIESVLMEIPNEMAEALAGLNQNDADYLEKANEIREYYAEKYEYFTSRINRGLKDSKHVFEDTLYSQVSGFQTAEEALSTFQSSSEVCFNQLSDSYTEWQVYFSKAMDAAGTSAKTFADDMTKRLKEIRKENDNTAKNAEDMADDFEDAFEDIVDEAGKWYDEYSLQIQSYINRNNAMITSVNGIVNAYKGLVDEAEIVIEKYQEITTEAKAAYNAQKLIDDKKENNTKTGFYGTYTLAGKVYRTKNTYETESEASAAAHKEGTEAAKNLIASHQQNKAAGDYSAGVKHATSKISDVLDVSTVFEESTVAAQDAGDDLDSYQKQVIKAGNAYKVHNIDSNSTEEIRVGSQDDFIIGEINRNNNARYAKVRNNRNLTWYWLSKDQYDEISRIATVKNGSNMVVKGDLAVGDRIKSTRDDRMTVAKLRGATYTYDEGTGKDTYSLDDGYTTKTDYWSLEPAYSTIREIVDTGDGLGYYTGLMYDNKCGGAFFLKEDGTVAPASSKPIDTTAANGYVKESGELRGIRFSKVYYMHAPHEKAKKSYPLERYDTGGYTGEWDSSGRLAMLHQKEIVLNAHDTENFLAAVNIVRDLADIIDLRAAAQYSALQAMTSSALVSTMAQTLQQDVTIHAQFPNVRERTEIEAAFDNLINRASQFANRKN